MSKLNSWYSTPNILIPYPDLILWFLRFVFFLKISNVSFSAITRNNLGLTNSSFLSLNPHIREINPIYSDIYYIYTIYKTLYKYKIKYILFYPLFPIYTTGHQLVQATIMLQLDISKSQLTSLMLAPFHHFPKCNKIQTPYCGPESLTQYCSANYSSSSLSTPSPLPNQ